MTSVLILVTRFGFSGGHYPTVIAGDYRAMPPSAHAMSEHPPHPRQTLFHVCCFSHAARSFSVPSRSTLGFSCLDCSYFCAELYCRWFSLSTPPIPWPHQLTGPRPADDPAAHHTDQPPPKPPPPTPPQPTSAPPTPHPQTPPPCPCYMYFFFFFDYGVLASSIFCLFVSARFRCVGNVAASFFCWCSF